jgi:hypothetical protein
MATVHELVTQRWVKKLLEKDAQTMTELVAWIQWMENNHAFCDEFGQTFHSTSIYDAAAFSRIMQIFTENELACCKVKVGEEPGADKDTEYNNNVLKNIICDSINRACFFDGNDCDGYIQTALPIDFELASREFIKVSPRQFPLEVGYTQFSRTLLHIVEEGCLARWPYGSCNITLFYTVDILKIRNDNTLLNVG